MVEIVNGDSFESLGFRYSQDELSTALFALGLYGTRLAEGRITKNKLAITTGLNAARRLDHDLRCGLDIVQPTAHRIIQDVLAPYVVTTEKNSFSTEYARLCRQAGITVEQLFAHFATASAMISILDIDQEFV